MAELNYLKELTLNFNLRKPTSKRPTNVYAVVKVCGKQLKIPTTAKSMLIYGIARNKYQCY